MEAKKGRWKNRFRFTTNTGDKPTINVNGHYDENKCKRFFGKKQTYVIEITVYVNVKQKEET